MPDKVIHNTIDDVSLIIPLIVGIWGSILAYLKRQRKDYTFLKSLSIFIFDMFTYIGFTLLIYLGLIGYGLNELLSVSIAGFIGHQGARAVYLVELVIADKLGSKSMAEEVKKENK